MVIVIQAMQVLKFTEFKKMKKRSYKIIKKKSPNIRAHPFNSSTLQKVAGF